MLNQLDNYFFTLPEPEQGCLLFVRKFILEFNTGISEHWHYNTPFYYYKGRWMCYIAHKAKSRTFYLGFVHGYKLKHKNLLSEGRKQIKVYYLDAHQDLDIEGLRKVFMLALAYIDSLGSKR
ncbi:MAG TPA: DUF1801 domain-containing protein [Bacteroidia bacterium]|nr:DUF1801 domain-containing protein [Bacteroidia bacterium]